MTKRSLIQFIPSILDPLGLLNLVIVKLKILFQDVCCGKFAWDDILPESYLSVFHDIVNGLQSIAVHPILNNHDKINSNKPVSDGYIKEESFMIFLHGKLCDLVDISKVVAAEQFSYILKLFHVTLYALKTLWRFKSFIKNKAVTETITGLQSNRVEEVYVKKSLQLMNNSVRQLDVFVDNKSLFRCGGRINNANVPYDVKFPYFIPKTHYFTKLVVIHAHSLVLHNGIRGTSNFIRSQCWITQGSNFVLKIIHEYSTCKRYEGQSSQRNHHYRNSMLVKIMFSVILVTTTQVQYT